VSREIAPSFGAMPPIASDPAFALSTDRVRLARRVLFAAYVLVAVVEAVHRGLLHPVHLTYPVFRGSPQHLVHGQDLYRFYPDQQGGDLFKYSPTFALLFAPFALLPFFWGLLAWDLLNALSVWLALDRLLPREPATVAMAVVLPEVFQCLQSSQSDALAAALVILAFVAFDRRRPLGAAAAIAVGVCVKIFPLAGASFALFHRGRVRFGVYFLVLLLGLVALPLLFLSPHALLAEYASWRAVAARDAADLFYGDSLMALIRRLWLLRWPSWPFQLAATALLLAPPLANARAWGDPAFRRLFLCSVLAFLVLFNHMAERASFVIGESGVAIWYATSSRRLPETLLVLLTLLGLGPLPLLVFWLVCQAGLWEPLSRSPAADG
jgi:Glycosyltransferase family 87